MAIGVDRKMGLVTATYLRTGLTHFAIVGQGSTQNGIRAITSGGMTSHTTSRM